jgi:hypothetical protein
VPSGHQNDLSRYHARTRARGVNPWVYWPVRALLQPFLQIFFRLRRGGRHHRGWADRCRRAKSPAKSSAPSGGRPEPDDPGVG